MNQTPTPTPLHPVATTQAGDKDAAELIGLLNDIKPNFGDVGTRDIDVKAQRDRIDRAIAAIEMQASHSAAADAVAWKAQVYEWMCEYDVELKDHARLALLAMYMESHPTAPAATTPAASESIDTPEFRALVMRFHYEPIGRHHVALAALIAHINAHTAAQVAANKPAEVSETSDLRSKFMAILIEAATGVGEDYLFFRRAETDIKRPISALIDKLIEAVGKPAEQPELPQPAMVKGCFDYYSTEQTKQYGREMREQALAEADIIHKGLLKDMASKPAAASGEAGLWDHECPCLGGLARCTQPLPCNLAEFTSAAKPVCATCNDAKVIGMPGMPCPMCATPSAIRLQEVLATPQHQVQAGGDACEAEPAGDTGNAEADRIINRLMSSDPEFDDCALAAAMIRRLIVEAKGPDGFSTWKDAAVSERVRRVNAENCCTHGIHFDNACGACVPPRGTKVANGLADSAAKPVDLVRYKLVPGEHREWMMPDPDGHWCKYADVAQPVPAKRDGLEPPAIREAGLYAALRAMHWTDKKLAVIAVKDVPLGTQTYSGDLLDDAIIAALKGGAA